MAMTGLDRSVRVMGTADTSTDVEGSGVHDCAVHDWVGFGAAT
jgi:hypothetical protein